MYADGLGVPMDYGEAFVLVWMAYMVSEDQSTTEMTNVHSKAWGALAALRLQSLMSENDIRSTIEEARRRLAAIEEGRR